MADALPVLISYVDRGLRYRFNNKTYEDWFGHPRSEVTGETLADVLGKEAFEAIRPAVEGVLAGQTQSFETNIPYKDGGARQVHVEYVPDKAADGSVAGFYALVQDITANTRVEEALRRSEAQSREAQRLGQIGSWEWDAATDAVTGSDELFRLFGLDPQKDEFPRFAEQRGTLYPEESWERINAAVAETMRSGQGYDLDVTALRAGQMIWVTTRSEPITAASGGVVGLRGTVQDITDRKRGEDALRESESRYRTLFEAIEVGFCLVEVEFDGQQRAVDYRFIEVNPAFERQSGLVGAEGHTARELVPGLEQHWFDTYGQVALTRESIRFESQSETMDRWFDVHAFPAGDPELKRVGILFSDVTNRKRSDLAIRESEQRFRNMADHAPVMIWVTEPDGRCTYLNRAWYVFTGQTEGEAEGFGWLDAVHPDDRGWSGETFLKANEGHVPFRLEYRLRRADGTYRWAIDAASPRFGPDGAFLGYVGSVFDIDDRREIEDALRTSEERLRMSAEAARIGTWDFDPATGELRWDDRCKELFGISPSRDVDYDLFLAGLHPDDRDRTDAAVQRAMMPDGADDYRVEYRTIGLEDGVERWIAATGKAVFEGDGEQRKAIRFLGTVIDITDVKRADEALKVSETRFRTVFENAGVGMVEIDGQWNIAGANRAYAQITGYPLEVLIGKSSLAFTHEEDIAVSKDALTLLANGGASETAFEKRYVRPDGTIVWIRSNLARISSDGEDARFLKVVENISDVRLAREVLQNANATLEQRVAERTRDLESANEALRQAQKMEAIGQLTGGIAHDFNNMLTVIRGSADMLQRATLSDDKRRRYLDAIAETSDRAARLTGQLLAFARRQTLKPEAFDVVERVRNIADMLRTVMGSRVNLNIGADCDACFSRADTSQFETALVNMAVNARDAMDGEGRLAIFVSRTDRLPALLQPQAAESYVAISVQDSGGGIAPDHIDKIFEPFFTTKEVGKGTGLGLSQVYGFAKQSGGEIGVKSKVGEGTTFTLYLPAVPGLVEPPAREAARSDPQRREGRILVVEDNEEVGSFAEQVLAESGYQVTRASTADAALALLEADSRFDAVFSDVVMPGTSGIDFAAIVAERWPALPVVLTSGYSHVLAAQAGLGHPLLQKPYTIDALQRALAEALHT